MTTNQMTEITSSLTPIISEEEFLPLVQKRRRDLLSVLATLDDKETIHKKIFYFSLIEEADRLESFLDDHGARNNLRWFPFSELTASIRNIAIAGFHLVHILDRYSDYTGADKSRHSRDFTSKVHETLEYFGKIFAAFNEELLLESGMTDADNPILPLQTQTWEVTLAPKLPYTIKGEAIEDEVERIISIAQSYRRVWKQFRQAKLNRKLKVTTMGELVPCVINETMMGQVESILHNLQSEYDSYIKGGDLERDSEHLKSLRGLIAIPMHLFESLRWLTHFYERHEGEIRKNYMTARLGELVDNGQLFSCITKFGLKYCGRYLDEGNRIAERILSSFVKPAASKLPIPDPLGFHARPSTYISLIVQEHGTDLTMVVGEERFDCRSVLDMLTGGGMLADSGETSVVFEGDERALADLAILADHNYCEDQEIPRELGYLRIMRNL